MSEEQLRDVLARVVPEPPDSAADPAPVVRAARVRRRAQAVGVAGLVAVVTVAGVLGGRVLSDGGTSPQVVDEPSLAGDPYSAASCPEVLPESGPLPDLGEVTAVRYCAAGFNGFPAQPGPPDALLDDIEGFAAAVAAIPDADPARCAAVDVIPSDSRLAFELADGSLAFVPATMCTDVTVDGRNVDGADVTAAFVSALDAQRDDFPYVIEDVGEINCNDAGSLGPATPGRDAVVAATWCGAPPLEGTDLEGEGLAEFVDGWAAAERVRDIGICDFQQLVVARTDRGDLLALTPCSADSYFYQGTQGIYRLSIDNEVFLNGS